MKNRSLLLRVLLGGTGAILVLAVALDASGVLRPLPSGDALREKVRGAWEKVGSYEAYVVQGGQVVAGPAGRGNIRWERTGRVGVYAPDVSGFFHREIISGDERLFYQPGAELVARIRVAGLKDQEYAAWRISGYAGLHDLARLLVDARDVQPVGRTTVAGDPCYLVRVVPKTPQGAEDAEGRDAEFYRGRFTVPWTLSVSEKSGLPLEATVPGVGGSTGWDVAITRLRLNPPLNEADWKLPGRGKVRELNYTCSLSDPPSVRGVEQQLRTEVDRWRRQVMGRNPFRKPPIPLSGP